MIKILMGVLFFAVSISSHADANPSRDWNGNYNFPSPGSSSVLLLQADLIEKKDGGYYDSFGPGDVSLSVFTTNTIGTMNNYNTTIDGEDNVVVNDSTSYNSGNLDGSINITSGSNVTSNDVFNSTIINNENFIDE